MRNLGHWLMQQLCWDPTVRLGTCRPRPESRGPGTGARGDPEGSCIISPTLRECSLLGRQPAMVGDTPSLGCCGAQTDLGLGTQGSALQGPSPPLTPPLCELPDASCAHSHHPGPWLTWVVGGWVAGQHHPPAFVGLHWVSILLGEFLQNWRCKPGPQALAFKAVGPTPLSLHGAGVTCPFWTPPSTLFATPHSVSASRGAHSRSGGQPLC